MTCRYNPSIRVKKKTQLSSSNERKKKKSHTLCGHARCKSRRTRTHYSQRQRPDPTTPRLWNRYGIGLHRATAKPHPLSVMNHMMTHVLFCKLLRTPPSPAARLRLDLLAESDPAAALLRFLPPPPSPPNKAAPSPPKLPNKPTPPPRRPSPSSDPPLSVFPVAQCQCHPLPKIQ